jgi:WD40 repeat protein
VFELAKGDAWDGMRLKTPVNCMAITADGKTLATGAGNRNTGGGVTLWDTATGNEAPGPESGPWHIVSAAAFSPDGKVLVWGRSAGTIHVWDAAAAKETAVLKHPAALTSLALSPDGKTLASAGADEAVILWDAASGKERDRLRGHAGPVNAVAFSPDGKALASCGDDGTVRLWDAATGKETACLRGHTGPALRLAFSPDGKVLASGGADTTALVWDLSNLDGK